ncbi:MAG: NAD(P)/FAD-dependent oxidoreductase [Pseudomonadota bacterium]
MEADAIEGIDRLAAEIRRDLERIGVPPVSWTKPPADPDTLDVLIVGAGQMGLAASFALKRLGITRHRVIDSAPRGIEGPWVTYARMKTLRSPNHLVGPAQDIPSLTFRAYYEALHGVPAWEAFGKIPNEMWQDYLSFFRDTLALPLISDTTLTGLEPDGDTLAVTLEDGDGQRTVRTRHLILATGRDGLGGPNIPAWVIADDKGFQHSMEAIDFAALAGRRVVVVGNSASAFDNAAEALETGAGEVHMVMRRPALPVFNRFKLMVHAGFTHGFPTLSDEMRLEMLNTAFSTAVAPPHESVERIAKAPNFYLHTGAEVVSAERSGEALLLDLGATRLEVDHVILGTGFKVDVAGRPELSRLADGVVLWRDRPIAPDRLGGFGLHPYLGGDFSFTPRGDDAAWVERVHAFNIGSMASLGLLSGDIPGVGDGAMRLGRGIAAALFRQDAAWHLSCIAHYNEHEIMGDELSAAERRAGALSLPRAS